MSYRQILHLGCALALAGCTTVDIRPDVTPLRGAIGDRAGADILLHDGATPSSHADRVNQLASAPLTMASAVELALTESPELQARYAEIGIASAEMAAATELVNPVLEVMARPTAHPREMANLEFGLTQNLYNLLTRDSRRRVATEAFEAETLEIAADVVETAAEVRRHYVELVAARHHLRAKVEAAEATSAAAELAAALHTAGNISDLELAHDKLEADEGAIEAMKAELSVNEMMPAFASLIVLGDRDLLVPDQLPDLPASDPSIDGLEQIALTRRLDVASSRKAVDRAHADLKARVDWRLWDELNLGFSAEREGDGAWAIGPILEISLPLVARGNPDVAEAIAVTLKAENELKAAEAKAKSDVRIAVARLQAARGVVQRYLSSLLPLKRSVVELTQREYNFMIVGAFDLLEAKRDESQAIGEYVEALAGYWQARVDLSEAIGGVEIAMPVTVENAS